MRTVREWLCDNNNAKLLDEIVPLWPNIGSARQYASDHVPEALRTIVELMRSAKSEKVRLDATTTLLALAGVRPAEGVEEEKPAGVEQQRPAVLLNLFLGSSEQPIRTVSVVDVRLRFRSKFLEKIQAKSGRIICGEAGS